MARISHPLQCNQMEGQFNEHLICSKRLKNRSGTAYQPLYDIESAGTHGPNNSQDNSRRPDDGLVDAMVDHIFEDIQAIIQRHYQSEVRKRELPEAKSHVTPTEKIEVGI